MDITMDIAEILQPGMTCLEINFALQPGLCLETIVKVRIVL